MRIIFLIFFGIITTTLNAQKHFKEESKKENSINNLFTSLYKDGQFTGSVLIAEKGDIVYKKSFGFADRSTKEKFTSQTPCYIGSLSKQFTAMGIAILKERQQINYDNSLRQYFPELPEFYRSVTILQMLHQTSGIAIFNDFPDMTENDVLEILKKETTLRFTPGSKFEYCNANYTLLGLIIEKIAGKNLDDFLTENIFIPVNMKNTYVDIPSKKRRRAVGYYLFGDSYNYSTYIGGAAAIVSTVDDLYKWDQMLYYPSIISKKTLDEIFTPDSFNWNSPVYGKQSYGMGWFISDNDRIVQHDGGFAGFRSYIERQINNKITIIYISNIRHELKDDIRNAILNILNNKPYTVPKISAANKIVAQSNLFGMKKAISNYKNLPDSDKIKYNFNERECNSLAYYLLRNNRQNDAIQLFKLNTEEFPQSANVYDSLGEAYLQIGEKTKAIESYKKVLQLDPNNGNAIYMLKKIEE
ncbi:serine hydrolase [Flavobacterium sp.]|uniref:serine hydrolase n=1 Tax=Flavobacterium sp. TaxID=239 RepID=UPI002ED84922